ncbi:hypothetical protein FOA43_003309 [Brettanomyces nanus]|uniref:CMP/dCMP-type deaminase domain-containing protein n=1 Tax=Eeniella nana TaxID=13502 RepID=A0A875S4T3_EENNA|nr:uncharacterized protein FOA43_003309 [Brettanomyces nanus]QPG75923.1 hypothetical protein FOA43_003309 [Brettanomyces nanus]
MTTEDNINYDNYVFYKKFKRIQLSQSMVVPKLELYWIATIEPPQSASIVKLTKSRFDYTADKIKHLKRFRKKIDKKGKVLLDVVICPEDDIEENQLREILKRCLRADDTIVYKIGIPVNKPYGKELNLEWSQKYWPLVWKGNPMLQELDESFKEFDEDTVMKYLKQIVELSNGHTDKQVPVVTIFVDHLTDQVMSLKMDERSEQDPMKHTILSCINEIACKEQSRREQNEDTAMTNKYLCLNYDVYTTHEPCTMCSMALLHSRIHRLIYINTSPVTGAIGEQSGCRYMIHLSCTLNWKFEAFQYIGDSLRVLQLDPSIHV